MSTVVADPRTDLVQRAANSVDHIICIDCWEPGMPALCGAREDVAELHPADCPHPTCPLCEIAWEEHWHHADDLDSSRS